MSSIRAEAGAQRLPPVERPIDLHGPISRPFRPFPEDWLGRPVFEIFAEAARAHAAKTAVDDGETSLTYRALEERALSLARRLVARVGRGAPVGIVLANGAHYPVAMLGALAAGCPYVPLDIGFPEIRNGLVLKNARAKAVIVDDETAETARRIAPSLPQIRCGERAAEDDAETPVASPDDIAVIFYTSGSTGEPKGVHHDQRAIVHHAMVRTNSAHISAYDAILLLFAPMAPVAQQDIFAALLNGARLFIVDLRRKGLHEAMRVLRRGGITIYHSIPFVFRQLLELHRDRSAFATVRHVMLSTDRVFPKDVELFRRHFPETALFSTIVGSTECKMMCHWFVPRDRPMTEPIVPVGYAVPDYDISIRDAMGDVVAPGDVGEIVVTSRFIALGYWHDREATQRAFAAAPVAPGARSFRTGDLGRRHADGLVELIGRADRQIKIRGYRVDPGEIESAIRAHPGIGEAAVIARKSDDHAEIVAYVVPGGPGDLTADALAKWLALRLPDAMRPREIHLVGAIPMLGNFKQDILKLEELDREGALQTVAGNAASRPAAELPSPRTGLVAKAVQAEWSRQLGATSFDADATWEEAGGDSYAALEFHFEIETVLHRPMPMALLGPNTRPSDLVAGLERAFLDETDREAPAPTHRHLVFFLPGLHGPRYWSMRFVQAFEKRAAITVLDYLKPDPVALGPIALEDVVDDVIRQIHAVAGRNDSIYLLGYSYGGVVTVECARRLASEGWDLGCVAIIDKPPMLAHPGAADERDGIAPAKAPARRTSARLLASLRDPERAFERWIERQVEAQRFVMLAWLWRMLALLPLRRARVAFRKTANWMLREKSVEDYRPPYYPGRLCLFRASPEGLARDDLGWHEFCPDVDIRPLKGSHTGIFDPENVDASVAAIADTIAEYREKNEAAAPSAPPPLIEGAEPMPDAADPFADVREGTNAHRAEHRCFAFPFSDGPMLAVLARAMRARRILEIGTALGYTALWFAHGANDAHIDTIELDPEHVRLARRNFAAHQCADRITAHEGDFASVLPTLSPGYDIAFFDGFGPTLEFVGQLRRLLRPGGMLICSNLTIGSQGALVMAELGNPDIWLTSFGIEGGRSAISLLR